MKKTIIYILLFLVHLWLVSCNDQPEWNPPPTSKRIVGKMVENVSGYKGSFAHNEYFLIAEDGTVLEVSLGKYSTTKEGDKVASSEWYNK